MKIRLSLPNSPSPLQPDNLHPALLETLFGQAPIGIAIFDRQLVLLRCNSTWAEYIERYTPTRLSDVLPGKRFSELAPGAEEYFAPVLGRVLQGETMQLRAMRVVSGGIESFWDVTFTPLFHEGEVIGILDMTTDATERALALRTLEQRVVERTQEIDRRQQIASSLADILTVLNSSDTLDESLNYICKIASQLLGSGACVLHHIEREQDFVAIQASYGLPEALRDIRGFSLFSSTKADESILNRQPTWISDFRNLPHPTEAELASLDQEVHRWRQISAQHYRAWLAVPLAVRGDIYGSLAFYYLQPRQFIEEEIDLAQSFADQAALAIENARLRLQAEENAVIAERNRLARDLHDAVTQTLFSTSLIAEVLPRLWERDPVEALKRVEELRELTRGALAEMRTLLLELRPSALMDADINELFRHLAEACTGRARLPVQLEVEVKHCTIPPPEVKVAFYRITQEALNNVVKHASASRVELILHCLPEGLDLSITDDGCGFDSQSIPPEHLGVGIMKERATSIQAEIRIDSAPGEGTRVFVRWKSAERLAQDRQTKQEKR